MQSSILEAQHNLINHFKPDGATHYWIHFADGAIEKLYNKESVIPFVLTYWKVDENDLTFVWVGDKKEWSGGTRKSTESWFDDAISLSSGMTKSNVGGAAVA